MKEYSFTLKFDFHDSQAEPSSYVEQLYEGGCDDALIGVRNLFAKIQTKLHINRQNM
jgi:hypothetical protein